MSPLGISGRDRYTFELALDHYVCYPMETVELMIRVRYENPMSSFLCVHIPQNVDVESIRIDCADENHLSIHSMDYDGKLLTIPLGKYMDPGDSAELHVGLRLHSIPINHYLSFCAWMAADVPERKQFFTEPRESRSIELAVKNSAAFLNYLPEVYNYDNFINRFLMMFESFWKPVNQQISQVSNYFDPNLTPEVFLPWLASWVGMEIDATFPKERIRNLIRNAIPFFQSRGTLQSLKLFLEMYSGGTVDVTERKAQNMVLGEMMGIGDSLALGTNNKPNTVYVDLKVPASELERTGFTKEKYEKKISAFIRNIVPAHTVFDLTCKFE